MLMCYIIFLDLLLRHFWTQIAIQSVPQDCIVENPVVVLDNNSQGDSHNETHSISRLSVTAYRRCKKAVLLNSTLNALFILLLKNILVLINHSSAVNYVKYIFTLF